MTDTRSDLHLQAQATVDVPPDVVYEALTDVTQMGRWSPECTGGRWLGRAKHAEPGARFVGFNRNGPRRWATLCKVVTADPGKEFAFSVWPAGSTWRYRFEPAAGGGTLVTETREMEHEPASVRFVNKAFFGGRHNDELAEGMQATLQRIKAELEK